MCRGGGKEGGGPGPPPSPQQGGRRSCNLSPTQVSQSLLVHCKDLRGGEACLFHNPARGEAAVKVCLPSI